MILEKDGKIYQIKTIPWGWSYVRPEIRVQRKLWGFFKTWEKVWNEDPWGVSYKVRYIEDWSKEKIAEWYIDAFKQYCTWIDKTQQKGN